VDYVSSLSWGGGGKLLGYVKDREIWALELATPAEAGTLDCQDSLVVLYRAFGTYVSQHDGLLPAPEQDKEGKWRSGAFFWVDALAPYLDKPDALKCGAHESQPSSYLFNRELWGKKLIDVANPGKTPLLTEAMPRHGGKENVLYANGGVALQSR